MKKRLLFFFVSLVCSLVAMGQSTIKVVDGTTTTWDFTKVTAAMCADLSSGNWAEDTSKKMFKSNANGGDETPAFLGGLTINTCGSDKSRVYYDGKTGYCFNGGSAYIIIPVTEGQTVEVYSGQVITSNDITLTAGSGKYSGTVGEGKTSVKILRSSGATYITKIVVKKEEGTASDLACTSAENVVLAKDATSQITYTTSSTGAVSYSSSNTSIATVSNDGIITAVSSGAASITVNQAAANGVREGSFKVNVMVPYAFVAADTYTLNHTEYAFAAPDNKTYYFKNGLTMSLSQGKGEGYASLDNNTGMKCSAGVTYTINIPEGTKIYSAKVRARSNYTASDNHAQLGSIFGETITDDLPFSSEEAFEKTFTFDAGVTELSFTPSGNQIQISIELSTVKQSYAPTTIFSMKTAATGNVSIEASADHEALPSAANLTINGGSVTVSNGQESAKNLVTKDGFCMTNGNTFFTVTLDEALQAGDVITAKMSAAARGLKFATADAYSTDYPGEAAADVNFSYTVAQGDGICGETTFNVFRATSNSTYFNNFTITRPATIATVTVASEVGYATFYNEMEGLVANGKVYTATYNSDRSTVSLVEIANGIIPANTGVIIEGEGDVMIKFSNTGAAAITSNDLKGTATDIATSSITEGTVCVLGYENSKAGFYAFEGTTLAANKAYLVVPASAPAKIAIVKEGEAATGINTVNAQAKSNVMYNLAGQRINADAKGMVIVNGKVVVKK